MTAVCHRDLTPCQEQSDLTNLVTICRGHHWKVHEGGWRLIRTADGFRTLGPVPADPPTLPRCQPASHGDGPPRILRAR